MLFICTGTMLWATNFHTKVKTLVKEGKYNQAIILVETECLKEKNVKACKKIFKLYKKGQKEFGIERDFRKRLYYAEMSCENGISIGCKLAGDIYWDSEPSISAGTEQSLLKAAQYYKKACDTGDNQSCIIGNDKGLIVAAIVLPYIIQPKEQIKEMIAAGYGVDEKLDGMSPLYAAAGLNNLEVAKLLLENGADPMMVCKVEGQLLNAFDMAKKVEQRKGDKRMLELLNKYRQ